MRRIYPDVKIGDKLRDILVEGLTAEESREYWHNVLDFPACMDKISCPKCNKEFTTTTCFCAGIIECDCGHQFTSEEVRRELIKKSIITKRDKS
jgi:hypothetical protein